MPKPGAIINISTLPTTEEEWVKLFETMTMPEFSIMTKAINSFGTKHKLF